MTNDERNPKRKCRKTLGGAVAGFVIRISSFVIRICEAWFMGRNMKAGSSITLLWLGIAGTLLAHDPGLSTANVRLHRDRLEAVLVFSMRDVAPLADLDKDGSGQTSSLES